MTMDVNCVPMEEGRKTGTLLQTHHKGRLTSQKSHPPTHGDQYHQYFLLKILLSPQDFMVDTILRPILFYGRQYF